ncbi:nucleotidyltransferase family protein [Antarctobacter sp.]|uniref:nucleotidyltransferase family protein n=1 Tax=Antarctobacter sp. TaxID=1872577 RepID=UPI002B266B58|nr:nucleotidyltransferase family protein [Antarctobacter sp.]
MQAHLKACPSPTHRALLGLIPVALGREPAPGLWEDLAASDPMQLAAAAQVEHVQTLLGAAFDTAPDLREAIPSDLLIYFQEMHAGNAQYNDIARRDLARLGEILNDAGLRGCILKGGIELVLPSWTRPSGRFISDLDVLVEGEGEPAFQALLAAGAKIVGDDAPLVAELEAKRMHFPALLLEGGQTVIELHTRVQRDGADRLLKPQAIFADSRDTGLRGIVAPSLRHRMIHHVLHAQAQHLHYERLELKPRSVADHAMLLRGLAPEEQNEVRRDFASIGRTAEYEALDALTELVFEGTNERAAGNRWIQKCLQLYGQPNRRKLILVGESFSVVIRRALSNKEYRQRYFRKLLSPRLLFQSLRNRLDKILRSR